MTDEDAQAGRRPCPRQPRCTYLPYGGIVLHAHDRKWSKGGGGPASPEDNAGMLIRTATAADWTAIWPFLNQIVQAGETYVYDQDMTEAQARAMWMVGPPGHTVVAVDDETVTGTANMYRNRGGPGAHVASASFMVDPQRAGQGVGRALGKYVIEWARSNGFRAIQFNAVVECNEPAVRLWKSLGFNMVGNVPEAFEHPTRGPVGLLVMHRFV
jgi:GNAT superfamily N-acetyltransferase